MRGLIVTVAASFALAGVASAATFVVNADGTGDFATIQKAIDGVVDGDLILLSNGTFTGEGNRDLDYGGRAITVAAQGRNPETCVIDCQGTSTDPHRGFDFHSGEGGGAVLNGVTITNGYAAGDDPLGRAGALQCTHGSSPTLIHCIFNGNTANKRGGAVYCEQYSSPTFEHCAFSENASLVRGGGAIYCVYHCSPRLSYCTFSQNENNWVGAGMYVEINSSPQLDHCTFSYNEAGDGTCVFLDSDARPIFTNCTFANNSAYSPDYSAGILCGVGGHATLINCIIAWGYPGRALSCYDGGSATLHCGDIYGNIGGDWDDCIADQLGQNGNIWEDPLFCDAGGADYRLEGDSPCAPFSPPNVECDLIGAHYVGCGVSGIDGPGTSTQALYLIPGVPNPFATQTRITYRVPSSPKSVGKARVDLGIYDPTGRLIRALIAGFQDPGVHRVAWNGSDDLDNRMPGGVYLVRLRCNGQSETGRLLFVR